VIGAAERLIQQADDLRGLAAHYEEQGDQRAAFQAKIIELCLRMVAEALEPDEEAA
jgi:hypothetical protein